MKIKKYSEMLNETFKDDLSGMSFPDMMDHKPSYKDLVYRDLYQIVCDENQISEKSFTLLDELTETLEHFYTENKEDVKKIINEFDQKNKRSNFCAESIYDEFEVLPKIKIK